MHVFGYRYMKVCVNGSVVYSGGQDADNATRCAQDYHYIGTRETIGLFWAIVKLLPEVLRSRGAVQA